MDAATDQEFYPRPPDVTEVQERAIHRKACELVAAAVLEQEPSQDSTLQDAASQRLMGCFLTLKRQGQLRGCCGVTGKPQTLLQSLETVSVATAIQDMRFPPVSPRELAYLEVTVSLLHGFRPLTSRGEDRLQEVLVGQHGLRIQLGSATGILLPNVATEMNLDAEGFLQHVCQKARLSPDAWKDGSSRILTFHSYIIGGDFPLNLAADVATSSPPLYTSNELKLLVQHCYSNLQSLSSGATPSYYAPNCPDAMVNGVGVQLRDTPAGTLNFSTLSLRPGVPLQSTLFQVCELLAKSLAEAGIRKEALEETQLGVTILTDPVMHGSVSDVDLRGLDTQHRACLVKEGDQSAWNYQPALSTAELVNKSVQTIKITNPQVAQVFSLAVQSSHSEVSVSNTARPHAGSSIRSPAVAGSFYPSDSAELDDLISNFLTDPSPKKRNYSAVMVPHAGLKYSGAIAAAVFQHVEFPETIIILGPKHTRLGVNWAVAPHDAWSIPGSTVAADPVLANRFVDAIADLQLDAGAHAQEHAIEVELPFLAKLAPQSRIVGMALGGGDFQFCRQFSEGLSQVLKELPTPPLLVISSDMNHFASDAENRRLDDIALQAMETLHPSKLYDTIMHQKITMCGMVPAVIVMETLRLLGNLTTCQRMAYGTSADVSGDTTRVVGYAGMAFS